MKKKVSISIGFIVVMLFVITLYLVRANIPIYPLWANKVTRSYSMREIDIKLSTGKVEKGKFVPAKRGEARRLAQLRIPRAYIDWKPYLRGDPISNMHIDAALPDLTPNIIWKKDYLNAIRESEGEIQFEDEKSAHKQWVRIEFGLYGFSNSMCETECTREEHNEKVVEYYLGKYDRYDSANLNIGLKLFTASSESGDVRRHKFYLPIDQGMGHYFIDCDRSLGNYQWCTASSILNHDMFLRYQFEVKHLAHWKELDLRVRTLVNELIISHETEI
jgi:hypothetical protein